MEANIDNSNKVSVKNIELNQDLTNTINEIASMPYVKTVVPDKIDIDNIKDQVNTETNTVSEITTIDYVGNTNENRTTFIITNETRR